MEVWNSSELFQILKDDAVKEKIDEVEIPKHPDNRAMESALLAGDLGKVAEQVYNVFDPVVTQDHLELNYIKSIFNSYGARSWP